MYKPVLTLILFLFAVSVTAQNPAPAGTQAEATLIMNATAHLGNGHVIENAAVGFRDGKIVLAGDATRIRIDRTQYPRVINGSGMHLYPGLIECNSVIGLSEIELVRATRDFREVGEMNPNVRSLIAYNTDSKIQPTLRSNGVLVAQVVPQGGVISGTSSVVALDGWNWEDAVIKADGGVHLNWPRMYVPRSKSPEEDEKRHQKIQKDLNELMQFFREAKAYSELNKVSETNLRFESMKKVFKKEATLFVHCSFVKEIVSAVELVHTYGIRMVLVGARDAWRVTDLLVKHDIPVILEGTHMLPAREDEDTDLPYKLPVLLMKAGVKVAISIEGSWQARNLSFNAGTAVAFGLNREEALMTVTSIPAQILGISDRLGTIEVGKDATFFLTTGDALDMRSNHVTQAFISGREINLDNVQKQLYRKYLGKYGLEESSKN